MRHWLLLLPLLGAVAAASAQDSLRERLSAAEAEAVAAERRAASLRAQADEAASETAAFAARRQALAEEIAADEARLTEENLRLEAIERRIATQEARMERAKAPMSGLLAAIATLGRQPPLLALADSGSVEEMVRVQLLIDASLPTVRERAASVEAEMLETRRLAQEAEQQRTAIAARQARRDAARSRLAEQEAEARAAARALADAAFSADRASLAVAEDFADLGDTARRRAESRVQAQALARYDKAPPRPAALRADSSRQAGPAGYRLPTNAAVSEGLGRLREGGIRARGIVLATRRGNALVAPAAGRVTFAGPFRGYDGVLILDHGNGWASLLTGVSTGLESGDSVTAGAPIGRALGPIGVELWQNGTPRSPAIIAGSSK